METLPAEILVKILKYLDLNDQIKCRLVSAKWRFLIDNNVKIKSLLIQKSKPKFNEVRLFSFDCELKLITHRLIIKSIQFFESQFIQTILRNLKQLHINFTRIDPSSRSAFIDQLNQFEHLEHLKIENLYLSQNTSCKPEFTLQLANLKCLSLSSLLVTSKLNLNTPKLYALEIEEEVFDSSRLNFMYPQLISHLKTDVYEEQIEEFINLEYYYVRYVSYGESYHYEDDHYSPYIEGDYWMPDDILILLPKLKEIHVACPHKEDVSTVGKIKTILSSKNKQRRLDFKFYYCGLAISSINDLITNFVDERNRLKKMNSSSDFQFLLDNFSRLPNFLCWNKFIDYSLLLQFFAPNEIDEKFLNRFTNLMKIKVDGLIGDLELFNRLIRKSQYLVSLKIINVSLGQSFYENLLLNIQHIKKLSIINEDPKLNFEFILKLNNLKKFKTDHTIPFALVLKDLSKLDDNEKNDYIYSLHFKFLNKPVHIDLVNEGYSDCSYTFSSETTIEFDDKDNLCEFVRNLAVFD